MLRIVQHEIRIGVAGVRTALDAPPVIEKEISIAGALDPLEELFGNDLVGVDVRQRSGVQQCW